MGILDLFKRKTTCDICGSSGKEMFTVNDHKHLNLCRPHLIDEFKKGFLAAPFNMVVVEFDETAKSKVRSYCYYPIDLYKNYYFTDEDKDNAVQILASINGKACSNCGDDAKVFHVDSSIAQWNVYRSKIHKDFLSLGKYLCKKCSLNKQVMKISGTQNQFLDCGGLGAPFVDEGWYVTTLC